MSTVDPKQTDLYLVEVQAARAAPQSHANSAHKPSFDSIAESSVELSVDSPPAQTANNLITQLENKVSSLWTAASQKKCDDQCKGLLDAKQDLLSQLASAKESLITNKALQSNVQYAENKLKELTERVKKTDVGIDLNSVSSHTSKALDSLDSKLEIVEQQATKFVSLLTSFFSSMVVISSPEEQKKEIDHSMSCLLTSVYGNSRYDSDLQKLHTTESFYLSDELDNKEEPDNFEVNAMTQEITALLERYPTTLEPLMNELVPVKLTYQLFWYRYFKCEQQLKQQEEARRHLLSKPRKPAPKTSEELNAKIPESDEEEDFTWDDDEEEAAEIFDKEDTKESEKE